MIVVADSGPLHYLILLDHAELLRSFYRRVVVPDAVAAELIAPGAPDVVRSWRSHAPPWVEVLPVASEAVSAVTDDLDLGERVAIASPKSCALICCSSTRPRVASKPSGGTCG